MITNIIPLQVDSFKKANECLMLQQMGIVQNDNEVSLVFKDKNGDVHCLTDDKMRVEAIKQLCYDNVRIIRS